MTSDRNLSVVIGDMLGVIPSTEESLRAGLENIRGSLAYAPPENAGIWWQECMDLLIADIGWPVPDDKPWGVVVERIFSGKVGDE